MKKEYKIEYNELTKDIINNEYFLLTKNDLHHGSSKYEQANIETVTKAGLLHDFFFGGRKEKIENSYLNHPNTALKNAQEYFNIDENIASAIKTHMFHHVVLKKIFPFINRKEKVNFKETKPTNKESWIVCISDLLVSIMECQRFEFSYIANLSYLIILNIIFIKH